MPSRSTPSHPLTRAKAKRIWLRAQRLEHAAPFGDGAGGDAAAVEHLGYVQIDTINVIERCHHHILCTRIPPIGASISARRRASTRRCSNTGPTRCPIVPTRDLRFFIADMKRHRRGPRRWFSSVNKADRRKVLALHPQGRRAHDPRHRRRRAGREGPPLGEPQAVQARAATRLLHRRGDDQRARGHAQDLRADRAPFRLGKRRSRHGRGRPSTICSTARCARRAS